ncbi:hypothetical protein G6F46_014974 [Rhizopus delemar]|nr:hypothetical protein G6F46_014974 [Rhizopus delemar]
MAARIAAGITRPGRVRHWCRAAGGGVLRRGGRRGRGALRNGFETAVFRVAFRGGRAGGRAARLRQGLADGVRHEAVHGAAVAEADLVPVGDRGTARRHRPSSPHGRRYDRAPNGR